MPDAVAAGASATILATLNATEQDRHQHRRRLADSATEFLRAWFETLPANPLPPAATEKPVETTQPTTDSTGQPNEPVAAAPGSALAQPEEELADPFGDLMYNNTLRPDAPSATAPESTPDEASRQGT